MYGRVKGSSTAPWVWCFMPFAGGLASLLLVFLRQKPEFKVNAAMVCVSLIVPLYGVELILGLTDAAAPKTPAMTRVLMSKEKQIKAAELTKEFAVEIDTRGGLEVIDDLRQRGIDGFRSLPLATTFSLSSRTEASNRPSTFMGLR